MELLKNVYNHSFFETFLTVLEQVKPTIDKKLFLEHIFVDAWDSYELKQRMHHIANVLQQFLASDFLTALDEIKQLVPILIQNNIKGGYAYLFLPDFVEAYGLEHLTESVTSFELITTFVSCEFAIRPFIKKNTQYVMAKMTEWSFHSNVHVRRLASEGCRPRLPWAMALPDFKKDPKQVLIILENLRNDSELYVRKSVANNLNDISKDHPKTLIDFTKKYYGETDHTNWILKHANRNLLKQGEPKILAVFGYGNSEQIDVQNFTIDKKTIYLGDNLIFNFDVINNSKNDLRIRLEYAVYYVKNNGTLSKKVFQIGEKNVTAHSRLAVEKKQHFKPISTRKYYSGLHKISITANGKEFDTLEFNLKL